MIIPNYNGLKLVEPCFAALERQICGEFRILIVNNGSEDGSVEWLKEHEVPAVYLEASTGFFGAVSVDIRAADTPHALLLSNDTEVEPESVGEMAKVISRL